MAKQFIHIEMFRNNKWTKVATVEFAPDWERNGYRGATTLAYDIDYAVPLYENDTELDRVGCRYPVNFDNNTAPHWPAFLLDMVPTGPARTYWLNQLALSDDSPSSWLPLLKWGAGSPPGNLRVADTEQNEPRSDHPGFSRDEIIEKNADFIEYAESCGAIVSGASDVQGQAPKFLLVQDRQGRWHAENALPDDEIASHWIVKFPRGKAEEDRTILRNEGPYYQVAKSFGIATTAGLTYENGSLFIPRFDRRISGDNVVRYGLESLCSVANICEFGTRLSHNDACRMISIYSSAPQADIEEYVKRDVLNTALRNTDNHSRNSAFLKTPEHGTRLSPLFDFAPMFLDPQGIARSSRWQDAAEPEIGIPDWNQVTSWLSHQLGLDAQPLKALFQSLAPKVDALLDTMNQCHVESSVIDRLIPRIQVIAKRLYEVK
ncbi:HipA domain-containing protein [uncultured Desulfuromonas sp.]|uniref:type II toxin-antitoxin system HipA family toxin n=1 Tax=uncultured Desulfuromonas sp. TaxID=181013 RepID=UPI002AAB3C2E|nr:HipA domain-containing protein [uncultured Desulfuromonas sp.]